MSKVALFFEKMRKVFRNKAQRCSTPLTRKHLSIYIQGGSKKITFHFGFGSFTHASLGSFYRLVPSYHDNTYDVFYILHEMLLSSLTSYLCIDLSATILAAASDYIGRRPIFIIASTCHLITSCIFFLVCIFELPLWLLICAQAILGLGGDTAAPEAIAMAYAADIYPKRRIAFRFVILTMVSYVGFGVSQLVMGQVLQITHNFVLSFSCAVILGVINLMYVCTPCFIPESIVHSGKIPKDMVRKLYLSYIKLFQKDVNDVKNRNKTPIVLAVTLLAFSFYKFIHEAIFDVITIYGIAAPFCWTPFETGVYAVMVNMFPALCK